jgi:hypothetical protein
LEKRLKITELLPAAAVGGSGRRSRRGEPYGHGKLEAVPTVYGSKRRSKAAHPPMHVVGLTADDR